MVWIGITYPLLCQVCFGHHVGLSASLVGHRDLQVMTQEIALLHLESNETGIRFLPFVCRSGDPGQGKLL